MTVCGAAIEGPRQQGTRSAVRWRKTCRAHPMRPGEIDGLQINPARCFQHQNADVRNALYRAKAARP